MEFKEIYPCLDDEVIINEVSKGIFYKSLVSNFSSAVEINLHYIEASRSDKGMKLFCDCEQKIIDLIVGFYLEYDVFFKYELGAFSEKVGSLEDLVSVLKPGIREQEEFRMAIPDLGLLIYSGFDLKLIFYWSKDRELEGFLAKKIAFFGMEYEKGAG